MEEGDYPTEVREAASSSGGYLRTHRPRDDPCDPCRVGRRPARGTHPTIDQLWPEHQDRDPSRPGGPDHPTAPWAQKLLVGDLTQREQRYWRGRVENDGVHSAMALQEIADMRVVNALRAQGFDPEEAMREMMALRRACRGLPCTSVAHLERRRREETDEVVEQVRGRAESKRAAAPKRAARNVNTQSQVAYKFKWSSPRFHVLGWHENGGWSD